LKIKVQDTELKVGSLSRKITSLNILPFRYELFGSGINIICQLCDEENCICFEQSIFINNEKLESWGKDDNYIVDELLIRLGLNRYNNG